MTNRRSGSVQGPAPVCPGCGGGLSADAERCPSCGFTGSRSMEMFPGPAPPFLPILDAAGIWTKEDTGRIVEARENLRRHFPQFHWHLCSVDLPAGENLSLFGFWLLNACPPHGSEGGGDRAWTILLVINAGTGQAAVVPGYSVEPWLGDDEWKKALASMGAAWASGRSADAVIRFFQTSGDCLEVAWKTRGQSTVMEPVS